jgi:hypothetical protein
VEEILSCPRSASSRISSQELKLATLISRAVIEFGWEPFLVASALDPDRMGQILDCFGQASVAVIQGWMQGPKPRLLRESA